MEKQSNDSIRNHFPNHFRDKKQMVIIHPYRIASLILGDNDVGECLIDGHVFVPTVFLPDRVFRLVGNLIMERRPKNLLAIMVVMAFNICISAKHRYRPFMKREMRLDLSPLDIAQCLCRLESARVHQVTTIPSVPIHT
jgi:hypothetical protein